MLRAFISFASEDFWARDFLVRQGQFGTTPWTFEDGSLREAFNDAIWKKKTLPLIQESDLLILLIGEETHLARGAIWEVERAREMSLPIFGIQIRREAPGLVPYCMNGLNVIPWDFELIKRQLNRAGRWARRQAG